MNNHLPDDPETRKGLPIASGLVDYFPDALIAVAELSRIGNDKHNPGQPLHWDRTKSGDEADALMRHFVDRGNLDTDGVRHSAKVAWRSLALLQKEIENELESVKQPNNVLSLKQADKSVCEEAERFFAAHPDLFVPGEVCTAPTPYIVKEKLKYPAGKLRASYQIETARDLLRTDNVQTVPSLYAQAPARGFKTKTICDPDTRFMFKQSDKDAAKLFDPKVDCLPAGILRTGYQIEARIKQVELDIDRVVCDGKRGKPTNVNALDELYWRLDVLRYKIRPITVEQRTRSLQKDRFTVRSAAIAEAQWLYGFAEEPLLPWISVKSQRTRPE